MTHFANTECVVPQFSLYKDIDSSSKLEDIISPFCKMYNNDYVIFFFFSFFFVFPFLNFLKLKFEKEATLSIIPRMLSGAGHIQTRLI